MTEHSLWRFSRALQRALNERQFDELADLIDDEVDWAIYGPIEMFPFLGARKGKAAALDVCRQLADNIALLRKLSLQERMALLGPIAAAALTASRMSCSSRIPA